MDIDIRIYVPADVFDMIVERDERGTKRTENEYELPIGDDMYIVLTAR